MPTYWISIKPVYNHYVIRKKIIFTIIGLLSITQTTKSDFNPEIGLTMIATGGTVLACSYAFNHWKNLPKKPIQASLLMIGIASTLYAVKQENTSAGIVGPALILATATSFAETHFQKK